MTNISEARNFAGVKSSGLISDTYDNFIGGNWVKPMSGEYFDNPTPITGATLCKIPRSKAEDVDLALNAAHAAKDKWAATAVAERARVLEKIADRLEANLERIAHVETWDNGKPIRETMAADMPRCGAF